MRYSHISFYGFLGWGLMALLMMSPFALAQEVRNGDMEGGFTDGVANEWTGWISYGYDEADFVAGTDYYQSPTHSQKFIANQPSNPPMDMAICQVVNTAAGQTYTFSLKLRTWIQGNESYGGEHLNVHMGLDPTGGTNIHSVDIEWHEMSNDRDVWRNESFDVTAECCWTTIFIKATRKFPAGGNASVWIDDVTVSGPPPDPTWTYTPTVTPTPTPPIPIGPELVNNGNFEDGFTGGVGNGWTNWSTVGNGYWKQSTLVGKAGGGNYWVVDGWYEDMVAMNPKTILLCHNFGASQAFAQEPNLDDTIIVGRWFFDDYLSEIYNGDYQAVAEWLADNYYQESQYNPRIDAWLGMNEPDWGGDHNWGRAIAFETYFTQLMHQRGLKTVVLNLSTGSPGDMDRILWCKDLFEIADYYGHHTYGGPNDQLMITPYLEGWNENDPYDFSLRVRRIAKMYKDRGWKFPPTIYTEATTYFGWHGGGFPDATDVRDDMINYIPFMNQDRWCTGMTIFVVGGQGLWAEWDITGYGIAQPVGVANSADPADKTSGLYSQQFGVGTLHCLDNVCNHNGIFTGGIVQRITGLTPSETYRLGFDFKWEHANGPANLTFQYGLDWTGQTSNGNAATINWSNDLITLYDLPHDTFLYHYDMFAAQSSTVSVWFKSSQNLANVSYRIDLDSVSLQQVSGEPPATNTPAPTSTATPTPEPGQGLLNGDMEGGFTNGVANEWTSYCTNGNATFADGTDQKHGGAHSQKIIYPEPASGDGHAGIFQVVDCSPGQDGTLTAWKYDQLSGSDPYALVCKLGYDLSGGTNPQAGSVVWAEFDCTPHQTWLSKQVEFTTTGSSVTVFLEAWHKGWNGTHRAWFDDCTLDGIGGPQATNTPVPSPTDTPIPPPTSTPTPTPEPGQGLQNGDMEGGFTGGVANYWTSYVTNGNPTFSDGTDQKHGGAHSQKIVYPEPASGDGHAGICQVVTCSPGQNGTLTAWKYDQLSGSDPWALVCKLGYDLSGGTNPQGGSVVWAEFDCTPHETWLSKQVQFTTTGNSVTVFLEAWHKGWNGTHTAWFDDVTLDGVGGPPQPTNTPVPPTPTNTPSGLLPITEDFETMPSWSSEYDAGWGSPASWSIQPGGQSGNYLQASRSSEGSSAKVLVYDVPTNTDITIGIYMRCPYFGGGYWMETGYRLGNHTAQDFDQNSGAWTIVKKFDSYGGQNGNGNTWTQYTADVNTGSNTQISIGVKLGSSGGGGPTVGWDTLVIDESQYFGFRISPGTDYIGWITIDDDVAPRGKDSSEG